MRWQRPDCSPALARLAARSHDTVLRDQQEIHGRRGRHMRLHSGGKQCLGGKPVHAESGFDPQLRIRARRCELMHPGDLRDVSSPGQRHVLGHRGRNEPHAGRGAAVQFVDRRAVRQARDPDGLVRQEHLHWTPGRQVHSDADHHDPAVADARQRQHPERPGLGHRGPRHRILPQHRGPARGRGCRQGDDAQLRQVARRAVRAGLRRHLSCRGHPVQSVHGRQPVTVDG